MTGITKSMYTPHMMILKKEF